MQQLCLDGLWRCAPDPFQLGLSLEYHMPHISDAEWRQVMLPSAVADMGDEFVIWKGKIWYRRHVAIPGDWKGQRITFEGDGLFDRAKIFINGDEAGAMDLPYLPWEVEVKAEAGSRIYIAIELDCATHLNRCPGVFAGWRQVAGIMRSMRLKATAWTTLHLASLATDGSGNLSAGIDLRRHSQDASAAASLRWRVETLEGQILISSEGAVAGDKLQIDCNVPGVRPWRTDDPALYRLIVESADASDKTTERLERNIGFRRIAVENTKLCLDGQPIALAGANMHEDRPGGEFRYTEETLRDLLHMKELGANCVRLCHYPHDTRTLDACDKIGLFVFAEEPLYGSISKDNGQEQRVAHAAEQIKTMIARDIHHPSIIIWSVSNEAGSIPDNGKLVKIARALDPNRPTTHVSCSFFPTPDFEEDDLVCVNAYPSWLHKSGDWKDAEDPIEWWRKKMADLSAIYPNKPILITEFGHPTISGGSAGKCDEEAQAIAIAEEPKGMDNPAICGTIIWCWADHLWPVGIGMGGLSTSIFGLLTRDRKPKRALAEASKVWRARLQKGAGAGAVAVDPDKNYPIIMTRDDLNGLPQYKLPAGYTFRWFQPGDEKLWIEVQSAAESFIKITEELYRGEFGKDADLLNQRQLFIMDEKGKAVATASAWNDKHPDLDENGRIHWVAIVPEKQGLGLAKPLMSAVCSRLADLGHKRAFLATSSARIPALNLYTQFGFKPVIKTEQERAVWDIVEAKIKNR